MKWNPVQHPGMVEYELPGERIVEVPEGFSDALEQFGFDEREVRLEGMEGTATVLVPSPMGELPGEVSSKSVDIPRAIKLSLETPMEPMRLAVEDRPGPARVPESLEEAMSVQTPPPTVEVPEDLREYLPFEEAEPP